jgi:hypothetical protein
MAGRGQTGDEGNTEPMVIGRNRWRRGTIMKLDEFSIEQLQRSGRRVIPEELKQFSSTVSIKKMSSMSILNRICMNKHEPSYNGTIPPREGWNCCIV